MRKALLFLLVILLPISLFASSGWNIGIEGGYTMGFYDQRGEKDRIEHSVWGMLSSSQFLLNTG